MARLFKRGHATMETRVLAILTAVLVVFGVIAIYSSSSIVAVQDEGHGWAFAWRQLQGVLAGAALLVFAAHVDYRVWERHGWGLVALTLALLLTLLLPFTHAIAPVINGARRWIVIGGVRFQPSEFAKLAVVVWTAMIAVRKGIGIRDFKRGVLPFVVVLGPLAVLILLEPDLSTAVLVSLIAGVVLFTAGAKIGHFILIGGVAALVFWQQIASVHYRILRLLAFLGLLPESSSSADYAKASWQTSQSLLGIGAGGFGGVGFGEGMQKLGYLPYAYSDFIFSTIGEEFGFIGVTLLLGCFAGILWMGHRIAKTTDDPFAMLMAIGLTAIIGVTTILHVAVTLDLAPATGLPLPFISYGRSSLVVCMVAIGILINIGERRPLSIRR